MIISGVDCSLIQVIVIGASAGGLDALLRILPALKKNSELRAAVVLHLPSEGPNLIPALLDPQCEFKVKEASSGEPMEADHIYVAPTDYHLSIERDLSLSLSFDDPVHFSRPSIDVLFESAAFSCPKRTLGILLSGANHDGAQGLHKIKSQGGLTVVQDPQDAEYSQMPHSALDILRPDFLLSAQDIAELLRKISSGGKK